MKAELVGGKWEVSISGEDFRNKLETIKALPERKYKPEKKVWVLPNLKTVRDTLKVLGYIVLEEEKERELRLDLDDRLYDFQKEGVEFIVKKKGRALLAFDMGTGKTCTTLSYVSWSKKRPVIIVCPASVKSGWFKEIMKWMEWQRETITVVSGRKKQYFRSSSIVIINYDVLADHLENLVQMKSDQHKERRLQRNFQSRQRK